MIDDLLNDARESMGKSVDATRQKFGSVRTGRASPSLLDRIMVDYYGAVTPLKQLATLSAPEPRLLTVTPYDKTAMKAIEKAIRDSDLGLNPASQGGVIRVPLPALNEQRRKELVKQVHKLAEEGKIAIRHHRTESRERLKKLSGVSEDDVKHAEKDLQKLHDDYIHKVDGMVKAKEAEIMEV